MSYGYGGYGGYGEHCCESYGYGGGYGGGGKGFALIVVLFILLIIVGASWFGGGEEGHECGGPCQALDQVQKTKSFINRKKQRYA